MDKEPATSSVWIGQAQNIRCVRLRLLVRFSERSPTTPVVLAEWSIGWAHGR
jgi:hypothetical protein